MSTTLRRYRWVPRVLVAAALALACLPATVARAQAGLEDDRVMLQGFYWESYRHGHPQKFPNFGDQRWYELVSARAEDIKLGRFDLVWLPPPSYAGEHSAGYNPKEYFRLDNSYGSVDQHRAMLEALLEHGVEPVADIVINHRDGITGWADFKNPDWELWAVCRNDEAFKNPASGLENTPVAERGAEEESPNEYSTHGGTTYAYGDFRDIDHTDVRVRRDVVRYLKQLRSFGYRGWRYDMVHGYHARWIARYNQHSEPTFSVGEYEWSAHPEQRGWIWHTATRPQLGGTDRLKTASSVFDFTTYFTLKANKDRYFAWYGFRSGLGMVGDTTDGMPWKNRAVTFVENHDTGYRTNEDGTPQTGHQFDSFENNWEVEQAYAYVLTHPGVPCVYWKHYFDWRPDLRNKIRALVNARKVAGVHAGSKLDLQDNARERGVYAARVEGSALNGNGRELYVRVGGSDAEWEPSMSGYRDFREYAQGAGWKVWVKLAGNPPFQEAPLRDAWPVPKYMPPATITVPNDP